MLLKGCNDFLLMSLIIRKHCKFSKMESDCDISLKSSFNQGVFTMYWYTKKKKRSCPQELQICFLRERKKKNLVCNAMTFYKPQK